MATTRARPNEVAPTTAIVAIMLDSLTLMVGSVRWKTYTSPYIFQVGPLFLLLCFVPPGVVPFTTGTVAAHLRGGKINMRFQDEGISEAAALLYPACTRFWGCKRRFNKGW
jgi:hypothetical protein